MTATPPAPIEAEEALLGRLLIDPDAMAEVADLLRAERFYRRAHQVLYSAIEALDSTGQGYDLLTVTDLLQRRGRLEEVGGRQFLGRIAEGAAARRNMRPHAAQILDAALRRETMKAGVEIQHLAVEADDPVAEAQNRILAVGGETPGDGLVQVREEIGGWMDELARRAEAGATLTGLSTGYSAVDGLTDGLHDGDLIVLAGRPSMGKTTLAMNIADQAAIDQNVTVAVFSLEMPRSQLLNRSIAARAEVPLGRIRSGQLQDREWEKVTRATNEFVSAPLFLDDSPGLSPAEVRARCRRLKQRDGLGLIVIDYLQLMRIPHHRENRTQEVSEISRQLKGIARDLGVPVLALSQLNRGLENRPNKRPTMADLRESGAIEQDADVIAFLYRDEVYNEDSPDKGTAEIIIGKQRNGPTGAQRLVFRDTYCRFDTLSQQAYEEHRARMEEARRRAEAEQQASRGRNLD